MIYVFASMRRHRYVLMLKIKTKTKQWPAQERFWEYHYDAENQIGNPNVWKLFFIYL